MKNWFFNYIKDLANNYFDKKGYKLINKKEFYSQEYLKSQLINTTPPIHKGEMPLIEALPFLLNQKEYNTFCTIPNKVSLLSEELGIAMETSNINLTFEIETIKVLDEENEQNLTKETILHSSKNKLVLTNLITEELNVNNLFFEIFNSKINWETMEVEAIVNYLGNLMCVMNFLNNKIIGGTIPFQNTGKDQLQIEFKLKVLGC